MNRDRSKAEVWTEILVTLLSVGITVWVMSGKPKLHAYAAFYGAKHLRNAAAKVGHAAIKSEALYGRWISA